MKRIVEFPLESGGSIFVEVDEPALTDDRIGIRDDEDFWGNIFRVLGFPEGRPHGVWASGELRAELANGWMQLEDVKQPGYRLEPGFSGAPIWDEKLEGVVGMAKLKAIRKCQCLFRKQMERYFLTWISFCSGSVPALLTN